MRQSCALEAMPFVDLFVLPVISYLNSAQGVGRYAKSRMTRLAGLAHCWPAPLHLQGFLRDHRLRKPVRRAPTAGVERSVFGARIRASFCRQAGKRASPGYPFPLG